jgi:hypothetical protein
VNAIEELGEVVKMKDAGERVLAFAGWCARWVETGWIRNDFDVRLVETAETMTRGAGPEARAKDDAAALGALLGQLASAARRGEVYEIEDQGVVDVQGRPAYRSMMKITVLLAKPHELDAAAPGHGGRS